MIKGKKLKSLFHNEKLKEDSKSNKINTEREKRMKYKGIKIPKLFLNKNLSNIFETKRLNYSHRKRNNISSQNFLFMEKPRKKEITNYFYTKNKNIINDISLNSKRKLNNLSTITQGNIKGKYKQIKSRLFNVNINKQNLKKKYETEKNSMNTSFLSSKADDPFLDIKIMKYLEKKEKERNDLFLLVNNPFGKKTNGRSKLYPHLERKLILEKIIKPKQIKNDIYESINKEYEQAKSISGEKIERDLLRKKLLHKKLYKKKPQNKILSTNKFINKSGEVQKHLIENQVNLIKRKINSSLSDEINLNYLNNFQTHLYLSLTNVKDQVLNIRSIDKLLNYGSVIKDLVEEGLNNYNKK